MKYIPADTLIAEIERLYGIARNASYNGEVEGEMTAYDKILSFITSLQQDQPEVDLEKETKRWWKEHLHLNPENKLWMDAHQSVVFARHFYELGLNARKEETNIMTGMIDRDNGVEFR